jgi:hypothetical protein
VELELHLFDEVAFALRGMVPPGLGALHHRAHRYGIKAWFGEPEPPREHYEAQVVGAKHVPGARTLALEVGFHAEHRREEANDEVLARLRAAEARWRKVLGPAVVLGPFLGRADDWRRASETWPDQDLGEPDLALEIASRLVDYATAFEPLLRAGAGAGSRAGSAKGAVRKAATRPARRPRSA